MKILAIESSCDETSVAIVENGKKVYSNIIATQIDIHKEYGGVVPEIASRQHIQNILPVYREAMEESGCTLKDIDMIAATNTPGLIGSLLVGLMFAKSLSYANNIPFMPVNHLKGHIYSTFIENDINLPAITLVVSGGHTDMYYMDKEHHFTLIGETLDDAVGESYDKIARALGLPYPGGPEIQKLAKEGMDTLKIKKPVVDGYNFSFSGIKTFVTNYINQAKMKGQDIDKADVACSFQTVVVEVLKEKIIKAMNEYNVESLAIAGGVSANTYLREVLYNSEELKNKNIYFPSMQYCTDNAAMIACAAYNIWKNDNGDRRNDNPHDKNNYNREDTYNVDAISTKEVGIMNAK